MAAIVLYILGIICSTIASFCIISFISDRENSIPYFILIILASGLATVFLVFARDVCIYESIPAIEVYRGNTDLIVSYNDSIPVDSFVVYKKK